MKSLFFLSLLILISCQNNSENKLVNKNKTFNEIKIDTNLNKNSDNLNKITENKFKMHLLSNKTIDSIVDKIYNLNKIQELNRQFKISILEEPADISDDSYNFKVGFNRPDRFETRYIFIVKKQSSVIYYGSP